MITNIEMGVASTIRDALGLSPKTLHFDELHIGEYFEYLNDLFVKIDNQHTINQDGFKVSFLPSDLVHPIKVRVIYDYRLVKEDGKEVTL